MLGIAVSARCNTIRFEMASQIAIQRLDEISDSFPVSLENPEPLIETAMTTLGSKMSVITLVQTHHDSSQR